MTLTQNSFSSIPLLKMMLRPLSILLRNGTGLCKTLRIEKNNTMTSATSIA